MLSRNSFLKCVSYYPVRHETTDHHQSLVAERSKVLTFLSWTGVVSVRIPLETYVFILNFSLPPRSEQVNGAVANEIKHVHSPEVIVDYTPDTINHTRLSIFIHAAMLITLPRGYEKCPFGSLLSFIHIMYFHIHGIRSRVEQGAPWLQ